MPSRCGSRTRVEIVLTQKMKQIRALQLHGLVRFPLFVYQERKGDPRFSTESLGISAVPESDGRQCGTSLSKCLFVGAQLRNVLPAENSTVMAQENNNCRLPQPKRADANLPSVAIGQVNHREPAV